ncbi:porin family protein [Dinghuibacter silviterrae]|uniref:hypothetical protein n=1 Tax=Dinghuibacter silviterrae TaxID=1539049 RepID=UPI0010637FE4|nr:hypothetical protein [Dinghuibacter silviterrae]
MLNSVHKNLSKADSLTPKTGKHLAHLQLHKTGPPAGSDTLANPAPNAIAQDHGVCRIVIGRPIWVADTVKAPLKSDKLPPLPERKVPFLQVHGNILYDVNYYSHIDTPYNETDVYQHTIQTYLDILIKGQYPFRIYLTNHFSNSPLFHNFSDFNLSYTNTAFNQGIKDQLRQQYMNSLPGQQKIDSLENALRNDLAKLNGLHGWMNNPDLIQQLVEAREKAYLAGRNKDTSSWMGNKAGVMGLAGGPQGKVDTAHLDSLYAVRQHQADSLEHEVARLQKLLATTRQAGGAEENKNLQDLQNAESPGQLEKEMRVLHLSDSSLPKGYKTLMAVKSVSVGRSIVNYSELSAKDISINGLQAEYNPSNYYAVATGVVDYRFRDFLLQQPGQPRQYMNVLRYGRGMRDGNSVILTWYQGKRQLYSASSIDTGQTQVPASNLMGLTLQGNYKVTKNILVTAEVAKSSVPAYVSDSSKKEGGLAGQMLHMSDRSNEAYSVMANAFFPATQTRLRGSFKHLGENFQSFSVFTDGSAQTAWNGSLDQLLFKRQLDLVLSAYTNDFSNPYISQQYRSTTVFKSIQATWRRRNWPVLSVGYFPSSQLTKLGNGSYEENLFYTMVGNATYTYTFHKLMMNTTLVYTQFYNRASDSGFTYFNTKNLLLSQSVFLSRLTLQGNASAAANTDYNLYTLEGKAQYNLTKNLQVGAGVKYNEQTVYDIQQWGYSGELTWRIRKLGQIQFSADKGFIPGMNNRLVPNNTGRLTYFKTF